MAKLLGAAILVIFLFSPGVYALEAIEKVNINTATAEELMELPGIGPVIAKRIIEYREATGGFKNIEELKEVRGIGEAKFAAIKDMVMAEIPR